MNLIQLLNNTINFVLKGLMYLCFVLAFILWMAIFPILYFRHELRKDKSALNHPNLVYISFVLIIDRFFKRFIF